MHVLNILTQEYDINLFSAGKLLLSSAKILEIAYDRVAWNPGGETLLIVLHVRISFKHFLAA